MNVCFYFLFIPFVQIDMATEKPRFNVELAAINEYELYEYDEISCYVPVWRR